MARADRRRATRSRPAAATSRYQSAYVGTEGLFFQRLRRQAKWAFVFLVIAFGGGFVLFGVGSGGTGIGDILGVGQGGSSGPSVEAAQEKLAENPNNEAALRELATALQNEGRAEEAIQPLETYTALRARDGDALRELAGLYLTRSTRLRNQLQAIQFQAAQSDPGSAFRPSADSPFGQAIPGGPVTSAATSEATEQINQLASELQATNQASLRTYQQLARVEPEDANVQIQLADAAANAGDVTAAIAGYKRFLELAPDDPSAELVRDRIRELGGKPPPPK